MSQQQKPKMTKKDDGSVHIHVMRGASNQTGFAHKQVTNDFEFLDSTVDNLAAGGKGPLTFNNTKEIFKEGSQRKDVNIDGGTLIQPNIGGEAKYNNKNSTLAAGTGIGRGDWSYNVEEKVLSILKRGVSEDLLLSALRKGHKIKNMSESLVRVTANFPDADINVVFKSMMETTQKDMDASGN